MKQVTSIITIILGPNLQNIVQFIIRLSQIYCCVYLKFTVRLTYDSNLRSCDKGPELSMGWLDPWVGLDWLGWVHYNKSTKK